VLLRGQVSKADEAAAKALHKNSSSEDYAKELDAITPMVRPLEAGVLHVEVPPPTYDGVLLPLLEQQLRPGDTAGTGKRVTQLQEFFEKLDGQDARRLLDRLKARRPEDRVANLFHHVLHPATQGRLLKILQH
jgi:hypothetical protein